VILTDPPYGMGADSFGDAGGKMTGITHNYDDSYEAWQALMQAWAPLSFAVTKPQAHAYVFCDFDRFHELKSLMQLAGWYVFRTPLIVHKLNSGRVPLPDQGPRRQYELVLYAIKGKKPVTHIYPVSGDENLSHGAQKPVALYQNLLQRSVRPGDRVLDCFAGTAGTIPAGHSYQCEVTAIEQSPEYYALGLQRLAEIKQEETQVPFEFA
jgi:DNA modification methylase